MDFEEAHTAYIQQHLQRRKGERRGRLERGHQEAEKLFCRNIWWPLRENFDNLHPEFEVPTGGADLISAILPGFHCWSN